MFHYAHFLCDCLFPEIINNIYNYKTVIREKNIDQTLGNFNKIYEEVMLNKSIELIKSQFDILYIKTITYHPKEYYCNKKYFDILDNSYLYQRRFETAPRRGAIVQTVTGNLVEVSSAERIEIFNGVKDIKLILSFIMINTYQLF